MMPLFDMLNSAQGGQASQQLARQFGLTQQQAEEAMAALLPAFSQGLKRNASDPQGVGGFVQAMASGNHARYVDEPESAFSSSGVADGNGILGHLFGSKDLSRAVAAQAAQSTGIGQAVLQQMLPVLASMIMGGLFKQSTGRMGGQSGGNVIGDIIEQMMRGGAAGQSAGAGSSANPFGEAIKDMLGGGRGGATGQGGAGGDAFGGTPWGKMLEGMMGGGTNAPESKPASADPGGRARNPYDDLFGDMFETGRQTRDDYQKNTEAIFDRFLKGMDKHRR